MDRQDLNRVETKRRRLIKKDKKDLSGSSPSELKSLREKVENEFAAN